MARSDTDIDELSSDDETPAEVLRQQDNLRLLESIVEHITDGVLVTEAAPLDPPGPRIVYVNQALTEITGYTKEEKRCLNK